jgi:hypothetical protein
MTGDGFWKSWWAVLFAGGPILTGFVSILFTVYLYRHLPAMIEALENSSQVILYSMIFGPLGLWGKTILVHQIAGMLIRPEAAIRVGFLDARDVERFPPYLLRLLKINTTILFVSIAWLAVVCVVIELK